MMQSFLVALSAEQQAVCWQQANTAATEAAADTARRLADKKRPGRPCSSKPSASSVASLDEEPAEKKRKYTQWFSTPLIHDILSAYRENGRSARATVASLRRRFPRLPSLLNSRF